MSWVSRCGSMLLPVVMAMAWSGTHYTMQEPPKPANPPVGRQLPPDVHPDSRNRLPLPRMEELDEEGKKLLAAFQQRGASITESAPRAIRIYSPRVSQYMTLGNQYLRNDAGLDPKLREITILLAARAMDQAYEWAAHEATAREEGLNPKVIDIIKYERPVTADATDKEAAIITLGREVLYDHAVKSATFARALQLFGKKTLVDIVALMGHYTATAILLNTFDQQLREGETIVLPPVRRGTPR